MHINKFLLAGLITLSVSREGIAAEVLKGNSESTLETFSFRIQQQAVGEPLFGSAFFVAAHPDDGGTGKIKTFAVSRIDRTGKQFLGLTPEKVKFNDLKEEVANPLYDQGIAYMALFAKEDSMLAGVRERPVVVTNNDRKTIYLINNYSSTGADVVLFSVLNNNKPDKQNIPDATGAITSGIVQIAASGPQIFAAVKPTAGSFGDVGSGVAIGIVGTVNNFTGPIIVDAPTYVATRAEGNRAMPLDRTSTFLAITSNLAAMDDVVDMHWDAELGRLYVALRVTNGAGGSDGARAIAVGRVVFTETQTTNNDGEVVTVRTPSGFEFNPIAPTAAFDASADKIVGIQSPGAQVSIHHVRTMKTSSGLYYLIAHGGIGSPSATRRSMYALPIVSTNSDLAVDGTVADKTSAPDDHYMTQTSTPLFQFRGFKDPATNTSQMPLSTDAAAQIGGGDISVGDIQNIYVYGDSIFATVQTPDGSNKPGIFYSQALLEANGKIKGWTIWRRAAGSVDAVLNTALDPLTANMYSLTANGEGNITTVKRTLWSTGDVQGLEPLNEAITFALPKSIGGIQGLVDFVATSTVLETETPGLKDISLLVATGCQKIVLAQTSSVVSGAVVPTRGNSFGALEEFSEGTIGKTFPTGDGVIVAIEGGALSDLGPIVTAEIARDGSSGSNGWLFVGGTGGVAVLSKADGTGWDTATGLGIGLVGLTEGMAFKKVGNYRLVRKIIHDGSYLYILTNRQLDRIDLTLENPGLGQVTPKTLVTIDDLSGLGVAGTFLDAVISEKFAVIATNAGLFRLADGLDIRGNDFAWKLITLPEGPGPAQFLLPVTVTGRAQDLSKKTVGGNLYVVGGYRGKKQACLYRYDVAQTETIGVSDGTFIRVADFFVKDIPSYFTSYAFFRNFCATNGALFFGTRSKYIDQNPLVTVFYSEVGVFSGVRFISSRTVPVELAASTLLTAMIPSWPLGSWLVATDSGLRVNE